MFNDNNYWFFFYLIFCDSTIVFSVNIFIQCFRYKYRITSVSAYKFTIRCVILCLFYIIIVFVHYIFGTVKCTKYGEKLLYIGNSTEFENL